MILRSAISVTALFLLLATGASGQKADVFDRVKHGQATSTGGVKIHYASLGAGPLVVMIHGFPDFWYTWRAQMDALSTSFQVVAIDQRGYNLSDKPRGVENYDIHLLIDDVAAVIRHAGRESATIVGHDWGGFVAWHFAMARPDMTDRLIVLNLPHPSGLIRELRSNPDQIANSEYARVFQRGSSTDKDIFFGRPMTPQTMAGWVTDAAARQRYIDAFSQSDFDAMLNYYKANYPRASGPDAPEPPLLPKVKAPVLVIHGLGDRFLNRGGLAGTWDFVEKDLTIVTVPGAGHFVQQDAADFVSATMKAWLTMRAP